MSEREFLRIIRELSEGCICGYKEFLQKLANYLESIEDIDLFIDRAEMYRKLGGK